GHVYTFDSTTIDLCLNVFWWAKFRRAKAGVKMHTLFDVETQIPAFIHITEAKVHDVNAMDAIPYETGAYYLFDRGYFDLKRLYHIDQINAYFVIREKSRLNYEVVKDIDTKHNQGGKLCDQLIRLTGYASIKKYPDELRRIVFYTETLNRTFVYLTNNIVHRFWIRLQLMTSLQKSLLM
ncbi:MAG: IS4 family transposase, partial [Dysgonamonadaceae bacterium]